MKPRTNRVRAVVLFVLTLALGVGTLAISWRLQQEDQITEEEAAASSEEVTDADMMKTQEQRTAFVQKWQQFMSDKTKSWEDYIAYAIGEGARFKCDQSIMMVGGETLYGCDLNALFVIHELPTYLQLEPITPQNPQLNAVLDEMITQTGLLQKGSELGIITLSEEIYNSPTKDTFARFETMRRIRDKIGEQLVKKIEFEGIALHFHNEEPSERYAHLEWEDGVMNEAKEAAKAKMDFLYDLLRNEKITMEEAGAMISADEICYEGVCESSGVPNSDLDPMYMENAYYHAYDHDFSTRIFKDTQYEEELKSLGDGQISTVRTVRDYAMTYEEFLDNQGNPDFDPPFIDSAYMIFKVVKVTSGMSEELESGSVEGVESSIFEEYEPQAHL